MSTATTTVLLADDHEVVRAGLRDALVRLEPDCTVIEAENLEQALEKAQATRPDIVLLDLYMPGMNGTEGISAMRRVCPDVPVGIVSGSMRRRDVEKVMEAGARGFVPKTMKLGAMANAVRLMLCGDKFLPYSYLAGSEEASPVELTPREIEVLSAIADGKSNKQIARDLSVEEVTVKLHASNIFRKLEVSNRTEAALKARELDLI